MITKKTFKYTTLARCLAVLLCVIAVSLAFLSLGVHGNASMAEFRQLHKAIADGRLADVQALIEKNPRLLAARQGNPFFGDRASFDKPPLLIAAEYGRPEIVEFLLSRNENPNERGDKFTALHLAAQNGNISVARLLVHFGADINAKGAKDYCSPICIAAANGKSEMVKFLVEEGADVNQADRVGLNATYYAAANDQLDILEYLMEHGANLCGGDDLLYSTRGVARTRGHVRIVEFLDKISTSTSVRSKTK